MSRLAVAGLAVGVAALAGLTLVSGASSTSGTAQMRRLQAADSGWTQVLLDVGAEQQALTSYLIALDGGDAADQERAVQRLNASLGSAHGVLTALGSGPVGGSPSTITSLTADYRDYTATVRSLVTADAGGDRSAVRTLGGRAMLRSATLRSEMAFSLEGAHDAQSSFLAGVHVRDHRLRIAELGVLGFDATVLALAGLLLLAHQHRIQAQDERSSHQSLHDELTGVPNRMLLQERVQVAMHEARRSDERSALLLLDVDRFKEINDSLGHYYGDLLLREVANRLTMVLREGDTVARLGGDEFAVLLRRVRTTDDVLSVAERVLADLRRPMTLQGSVVMVSGSIGVALAPEHSDDAGELLRLADIAMYEAKRRHSGVEMFRSDGRSSARSAVVAASELAAAIDAGQMVLHYQPKLALDDGRVIGVEALVRWQHPRRGLVGPDEFVPVAEQNDLILSLTDRVIDIALADQRAWMAAGLQLSVAVNVGVRSLLVHDLAERIAAALERHGSDAGQLVLEITETAFITDLDRAMRVLGELRDLGVKISIDDFGTGYSSMAYLQALPADELKIDRSFVGSMKGKRSEAIVRATVELGHSLGLRVVAEGVEDDETLAQLKHIGCDWAQGYGICRPQPLGKLLEWLDRLDRTDWTVDRRPDPATVGGRQ